MCRSDEGSLPEQFRTIERMTFRQKAEARKALNELSSFFHILDAEMRPRFPKFREEPLRKCCLQVTHTFRAARAGFHPEHSLDHKDVVRPPQCDKLVVFYEQVLHQVKVGIFFGMGDYFDGRGNTLFTGARGKTA